MSGADESRLLDDAALLPEAHPTPTAVLVDEVRAILAAADIHAYGALLGQFGELVEASGPLGYLRFAEALFEQTLLAELPSSWPPGRPASAAAPLPAHEVLCDELHARCIPRLAIPSFVQSLRQELQLFVEQTFVPRHDRLAACAAMLSCAGTAQPDALALQEMPPLYAIFRAQLVEWLQQAGERQQQLLRALGPEPS